MVTIKTGSFESSGTMELDIVRFMENRTMGDLRDLVRWAVKPAVNRSEVAETITSTMVDYIVEHSGDEAAEKVLRKAHRLLELVAVYA